MADPERPYYYKPVPGSKELTTSSAHDDDQLKAIEEDRPSDRPKDKGPQTPAPQRLYNGEWLGGVEITSGAAVPFEVFDALAPRQSPIEQAVYIHLFRLAYGNSRNFCRVGKRELATRARISDRRLNVALDGLVTKGHIRPMHRSTSGTLYRVFLPSEVSGEEPEKGVVTGPRIEPPAPEPASKIRQKPLESPLNEERFQDLAKRPAAGPGLSDMVAWFFDAKKLEPSSRDHQIAVSVITELLEDGFERQEIMRALEWFVENQPEEQSIERLPYFINQALENKD